MAMKMSMGLKQSQSLMMTPQLQQAIKLLTLTHLEMTTLIAQEMVDNPMLEETDNEGPEAVEEPTKEQIEQMEATPQDFQGPELVENAREDFDWEAYADSYNNNSSTAPSTREVGGEDRPGYENMITKNQSLTEHLEWQLRMESMPAEELDFAIALVQDIDDDGYLTSPLEELIAASRLDRDDAERVLTMVQHLDPVGCGCSSLEETLMVQARALEEPAPLAILVIQHHLADLQSKDHAKIAKALGVSKEKIKDAELVIMGLHPKPGRIISPEETQYVVPDIFVQEVGGEFVIQINDEGVPRLRVSNLYRDLLKSKAGGAETQDFVQDKLRSALWLIKSIENRQKTIHKVAAAIVRSQQDFFKRGPAHLKPMILKDIAGEIGMHESTVSRVTTNKYMHTPLGTFELKYFFNTGIGGKNGGIDIAGETLKLKIKEMIAKEDPRRPLSDQRISELLSTRDIIVARRTVAKYREMMDILPSSKRKA